MVIQKFYLNNSNLLFTSPHHTSGAYCFVCSLNATRHAFITLFMLIKWWILFYFWFFLVPRIYMLWRYGAVIQPSCQHHHQWHLPTNIRHASTPGYHFLQDKSCLLLTQRLSAHILCIINTKYLILTILVFTSPHLISNAHCSLFMPIK